MGAVLLGSDKEAGSKGWALQHPVCSEDLKVGSCTKLSQEVMVPCFCGLGWHSWVIVSPLRTMSSVPRAIPGNQVCLKGLILSLMWLMT